LSSDRPSPAEQVDAAKARRSLRNGFITLVLAAALATGLVLGVPGLSGVATTLSHMKVQWVVVAVLLEALSCASYVLVFLQVFERAPFRVGARVALSEEAFGAAVSLGGVGSLAVGGWLMVERGAPTGRITQRSAVLFLYTSAINVITLILAGLGLLLGLPGPSNPLLSFVPAAVGAVVLALFMSLPHHVDRIVRRVRPGRLRTLLIETAASVRDTERLLLRYRGLTRDKIRFIPNWATLAPAIRPIGPDNPYCRAHAARFRVGLSGNLGFTHDPVIVFEAARLLQDDSDIHFLLSGWGIGFERLKQMQSEANLANVTLIDRVDDEHLEQLLSAADIWLIPYRKNVAGVSVPSRFYNLLAVGRPVVLVSEPDAEAALTVAENNLGWVAMPGVPEDLAKIIRAASRSADYSMAERAVAAAQNFSLARAMIGYAGLVDELLQDGKLLQDSKQAGQSR